MSRRNSTEGFADLTQGFAGIQIRVPESDGVGDSGLRFEDQSPVGFFPRSSPPPTGPGFTGSLPPLRLSLSGTRASRRGDEATQVGGACLRVGVARNSVGVFPKSSPPPGFRDPPVIPRSTTHEKKRKRSPSAMLSPVEPEQLDLGGSALLESSSALGAASLFSAGVSPKKDKHHRHRQGYSEDGHKHTHHRHRSKGTSKGIKAPEEVRAKSISPAFSETRYSSDEGSPRKRQELMSPSLSAATTLTEGHPSVSSDSSIPLAFSP